MIFFGPASLSMHPSEELILLKEQHGSIMQKVDKLSPFGALTITGKTFRNKSQLFGTTTFPIWGLAPEVGVACGGFL